MAVAGRNDGVGKCQNPGRECKAGSQHADGFCTTPFHDIEIETGGKYIVPAGNDDARFVSLCTRQRAIDILENCRRERIALAVVNANSGNLILQFVVDG